MQSKIYLVVIISILVFALTARMPTVFEIVLSQEDGGDTEIGGEPKLGGDTGMTESDLGGNDTGMTVSDIENDTEIINRQSDKGIRIGG
ncbi:MAG TPA: hypothetical protein VJ583_09500 [Nitrososphaeraceae archaeon]|nr:hypothetical protein [Nitrososphaeraceae archaeon]